MRKRNGTQEPVVPKAPRNRAYFYSCRRCLGHGHLILSSGMKLFAVFSQRDARDQLVALVEREVISRKEAARLMKRVKSSGLPSMVPSSVEEVVVRYSQASSWAENYGRVNWEDDESADFSVDSRDLTRLVHDHLLNSPKHPGLRLQ